MVSSIGDHGLDLPDRPFEEEKMQRITIALDDALVAELDAHLESTGGSSRSEGGARPCAPGVFRPCRTRRRRRVAMASSVAPSTSRSEILPRAWPRDGSTITDETIAALSVPLDHSTSIDVAVMARARRRRHRLRRGAVRRTRRHARVARADSGGRGHDDPRPSRRRHARAYASQGEIQFLTKLVTRTSSFRTLIRNPSARRLPSAGLFWRARLYAARFTLSRE